MHKVGLVTITFNSEGVIDDFIDSINGQDYENISLYLVDNNSSDRTIDKIRSKIKRTIVYINNDFNNGVAGGNNQGITKALEDGCSYIILINNDTLFEASLVSKLIRAAESRKYKIVVPKMMYFADPSIIWFAGGGFTRLNGYMNYHDGMKEKDEDQFPEREIEYAPTCCALIHKDVFNSVGLMDEKYFVYFDDTDFWYRVLKYTNFKMLYIKDLVFLHKEGSLSKSKAGSIIKFKFGDFTIKYTTRNRVYYLKKQKTVLAYINIIIFFFRINLRFFLSGKYNINIKTWKIIQASFFEGLKI